MSDKVLALELFKNCEKPPRPFVKWVGGKRGVLHYLLKHLPHSFNCYFEPFLGGGALFFGLGPERAVLADSNRELINAYIQIRDNLDEVISHLKSHVYEKEHYYMVRSVNPDSLSCSQRAARTIYLNKTGFNGLYRVNSKGIFNVPFGRHKNPTICDEHNLRRVSRALSGARLECASFERIETRACKGDFIYLDPPYIPLSETSNFVSYQRHGFGMENQERLARMFERLDKRGCLLMLSNSDVKWMKERYSAFRLCSIEAARSVNSKASGRGPVGELIVTNY